MGANRYPITTDEVERRLRLAYHMPPEEFRVWLAEVERAAAEKAWDEGASEGEYVENPYRKETP